MTAVRGLAVQEPLVEAGPCLGNPACSVVASTYMSLVLRQIETAVGLNETRQALHDFYTV